MSLDKVVIASKNKGKIAEIREILADLPVDVLSLEDYPEAPEIVEDGDSFFANALKKAKIIADYTGLTVIADDSGLEVDFLHGAPGIYSSRYAGENASDEENNRKLLVELKDVPATRRGAAFICVVVLCRPAGTYDKFAGRWPGIITETPRGGNGFGYDPLVYLPEWGRSVAELSRKEKNRDSHRAQAVQALKKHLQIEFFS